LAVVELFPERGHLAHVAGREDRCQRAIATTVEPRGTDGLGVGPIVGTLDARRKQAFGRTTLDPLLLAVRPANLAITVAAFEALLGAFDCVALDPLGLALGALLLAFDALRSLDSLGRALGALLLALDALRPLGPFDLSLDALLLTLDALRALCALDLTLDALLLTLDPLRTLGAFDALLLALDSLRALCALDLTLVPLLRALCALDALGLLGTFLPLQDFLALLALGSLLATLTFCSLFAALGFSSLGLVATATFLLRCYRSGDGEAGDTGDQ